MSNQNFPQTNRFRGLFSIAGSTLFVFLGTQLVKNANNYESNTMIVKTLGIITIIFFGGLLIWRLKNMIIDKK